MWPRGKLLSPCNCARDLSPLSSKSPNSKLQTPNSKLGWPGQPPLYIYIYISIKRNEKEEAGEKIEMREKESNKKSFSGLV